MRPYQLPDYFVAGEGNTTVYLLHGAYGAKEYWRYTAKMLNDAGYRVIAWDAPGYGISEISEGITIPKMAELAARLIDATRSSRTVLLGHSMGGMVAQKALDLFPKLVDALVLSATVHTFNHSGPEWQADFMRTRVAPLTQGREIADYAPDMLRSMMGENKQGPVVDHIIHNVCLMKGVAFKHAIKATSEYLEEAVPSRIAVPTLCIAGGLDTTCPASVMRRMATLMARGEFYEMAGVGHYGWAERPEEYHRVVLSYLERVLAVQ